VLAPLDAGQHAGINRRGTEGGANARIERRTASSNAALAFSIRCQRPSGAKSTPVPAWPRSAPDDVLISQISSIPQITCLVDKCLIC